MLTLEEPWPPPRNRPGNDHSTVTARRLGLTWPRQVRLGPVLKPWDMTLHFLQAMVLGLLLLVLGGCDEAPSTRRDWLLLELSPTRDFRETYSLSVRSHPEGAVWEGVSNIPGRASYTRQRLSRQQLRQFREEMLNNGIDSLTSTSDNSEAEAEVLYTRLEVHWGTFHSRTFWRGLDTAQSRIASVFLEGPMGENVARGLAAVRQRKQ